MAEHLAKMSPRQYEIVKGRLKENLDHCEEKNWTYFPKKYASDSELSHDLCVYVRVFGRKISARDVDSNGCIDEDIARLACEVKEEKLERMTLKSNFFAATAHPQPPSSER